MKFILELWPESVDATTPGDLVRYAVDSILTTTELRWDIQDDAGTVVATDVASSEPPTVFTLVISSPRWREPLVSVHRTKVLAERKLIDQHLADLADTDEDLARIEALTGEDLINQAQHLGDFLVQIESHNL